MASKSSLINITDPSIRQPPPGQTRPYPQPTSTGTIPFTIPSHPGIPAETWYALHGELTSDSTPLIILHGGPGATHNYLKPLAHLATPSRPVIFYDQLGCGNSTRLRSHRGDNTLWQPSLFIAELHNLLRHLNIEDRFDLLGQSWGGMLAAQFAATQTPKGLRRLVICDSPADMGTWVVVAGQLRGLLPKEVQETLTRCEEEGRTDSEEYERAMLVFYRLFVCRVEPMPTEFAETMENLKEDDTVYFTMNGPSEFHVIGNLKTWNIRDELGNIDVPTLLVNGKFDEAQDATMKPFFAGIKKKPVKWVRFAESSHSPQLEETDDFMRVVDDFLTAKD